MVAYICWKHQKQMQIICDEPVCATCYGEEMLNLSIKDIKRAQGRETFNMDYVTKHGLTGKPYIHWFPIKRGSVVE